MMATCAHVELRFEPKAFAAALRRLGKYVARYRRKRLAAIQQATIRRLSRRRWRGPAARRVR